MNREEVIADILTVIWLRMGICLLPEGQSELVLTLFCLLDDAIEAEVRAQSAYRSLQRVSLN
jgi:hypothetical protein